MKRQICAVVVSILTVPLFSGCQTAVQEQQLPSPSYMTDDVQYYAPGPEFKLAREAAELEEQQNKKH